MKISPPKYCTLLIAWAVSILPLLSHSQLDTSRLIQQSDSLYYLAKDYYYDADYEKARMLHEKAFEIRKEFLLPPDERLFKSHKRLASVYRKLRDYKKAPFHHHKAIGYSKQLFGEENEEFETLCTNLAIVYAQMMELDSATYYNKKILDISNRKYGKGSIQSARLIMNMALSHQKVHNYDEAQKLLEYCIQMIKGKVSKGDEMWNQIYNNYGIIYRKKGDYEKARQFAEKALEVKLKNYPANHPSVAKYHSNLGFVFMKLGKHEEALKHFKEELKISKSTLPPDHQSVGSAYAGLADIYYEIGELNQSGHYFSLAKPIYLKNLGPSHPYTIAIDENRALLKSQMGMYQEAIEMLEESIAKRLKLEGVAKSSVSKSMLILSDVYLFASDTIKALEICQQALNQLSNEVSNTDINDNPKYDDVFNKKTLIDLLYQKAYLLDKRTEKKNNEFHLAALKTTNSLIGAISKIRKSYLSDESKSIFNEDIQSMLKLAFKIAFQQYEFSKSDADCLFALEVGALSKSSLLWEMFNNKTALLKSNIKKEEIIALEDLGEKIVHLKEKMNRHNPNDTVLLEDELLNFQNEYDQKLFQLEQKYPSYYNYKYDVPSINLKSITDKLPDENSMLVNYYLDDEKVYVFTISKRSGIAAYSKIHRNAQNEIFDFRAKALADVTAFRNDSFEISNEKLYDAFIEPIQEKLTGIERLIVIPHGPLNYLSFEMLKGPGSTSDFLIHDYAFSYAYSINIWLQQNDVNRTWSHPFLGFAPFYSKDSIQNSSFRTGLSTLYASKQEIESAAKLFKGASYIDATASEENFKAYASSAQIIHLATHGQTSDESPNESVLFFGPENKNPSFEEEDQQLKINEIYNLDLSSDLTVLSACNSGYGELQVGEGIMSLSRAFAYAGSKSILNSLWLANDRSSLSIFNHFYSEIKKGTPKDIALQNAKILYLKNADPATAHPFFWAGFVLIGDSDPIEIGPKFSFLWYLVLGIFLFLGIYYFHKRT